MFYSLLSLTVLLSQLHGGSAASTQTRTHSASLGSIDALNNLVVIGDGVNKDVSFSYYSYNVDANNVVDTTDAAADYSQILGSVAAADILVTGGDLAGTVYDGLGHAVAIANTQTVFVSQTSVAKQTGRVVLFEGNVTSFKETQLFSAYDGKHNLQDEAAFGESLAAKHDALAVGCQNCNTSAPVFSGAVYVYKPNKEGRWSESQVLTAEGVLFLGERLAMHGSVLLAAGDDAKGPGDADRRMLTASHDFSNVANTVVVYEEGHHGKFEQRQVITTKSGSFRESITSMTVFDETIAITTAGTDLPAATDSAVPDKVYIYYPMNKRYGLEPQSKGKPKPSPQQWTNIQILSSSTGANVRYFFGEADVSISMNSLAYLTTTDGSVIALATSTRPCLSCKFAAPTLAASTAVADATATVRARLTADSSAFYGYQTLALALGVDAPVPNSFEDGCLTFSLIDQYNDGWGIASLVVTDPNGVEDKYTLQCDSNNPNNFKYCPNSQAPGKYHIHIENGEETPFGWEIVWKVAVGSNWYVGDKRTHMDFLWNDKYGEFTVGATKGLLPVIATCERCDANRPTGKHRSLSNLRSLHHKGQTSSPTISAAPTLAATGGLNSFDWQVFQFETGVQWFDSNYEGSNFWVSSADGKKLYKTGTSCDTTSTFSPCWVELPDGDYRVRAGSLDQTDTEKWSFCGTKLLDINSELFFTVLDQQCYPGSYFQVENLCLNTYKSAYFLDVQLMLSGVQSLSVSDESTMKISLSETMLSVLGHRTVSSQVVNQEVTQSGLKLSMKVEFESLPDSAALNNFVADTSSATTLLKYELTSSQKTMEGLTGVTILSVTHNSNDRDFDKVDESAFQAVTDHVWLTASVEAPTDNFNEYARYVAEGAYALVAVAAVLAVSLFVKRAMSKTEVVVEDVKA